MYVYHRTAALVTYHGRVVVAAGGRRAVERARRPRLLLHVEPQQVVEHRAPVVTAKHVYAVLVGYHCVFAASAGGSRETCRQTICFHK